MTATCGETADCGRFVSVSDPGNSSQSGKSHVRWEQCVDCREFYPIDKLTGRTLSVMWGRDFMVDPHNNIGRHCDILGIPVGGSGAAPRSWRVVSYRPDPSGVTTYNVENDVTGKTMIVGMRSMTNLY